jgi:nucleotide-binding universal stress UspA family protein
MSNGSRRPVVVGIDGSESALRAVGWAAEEAGRRGAVLRLVQACEVLTGYAPLVVDWHALHMAVADRGREWLDRARTAAEEAVPGLRVHTALELTPPVPTLIKESREAALLVLGSRGLGGFTGLVLGSTSVEVSGRAHCPVVVVRDAAAAPDGPVVVGVDGTPVGEAAIAFAFAEASARDADLVAVHAWSDLVLEAAYLGDAAALDFAVFEQRAEEILAERLAGWQEKYPEVHVTREIVRDRPTGTLLRHGEHARLLVVGSRGRGGFRGLLLGSTSQHLLHHAACPVAVVRTAQEG